MSEKLEELDCAICKHNIKKLGCFAIYSYKHNDVICSECCLLGAYYNLGLLNEVQLSKIPEKFRKEIITLYEVN